MGMVVIYGGFSHLLSLFEITTKLCGYHIKLQSVLLGLDIMWIHKNSINQVYPLDDFLL